MGCPKSALLSEECLDTPKDLLRFQTHLGILPCTLSEKIRGYCERNGIDSLDFLESLESFAQDGLFQSLSTTYHSMLGVFHLHFLSSMCLSSRFLSYGSCRSWVRWSPWYFLCVTIIVHGAVSFLCHLDHVVCVKMATNFCSTSEVCTLLSN